MTTTEDVQVEAVSITRRHASNSEVATFKRCRRKWWLAHSLRVTPNGGAAGGQGPLWIGTLVHVGHDARFKALRWGATDAQSIKLSDRAIVSHVHKYFKRGWQFDPKEVELARIMLEGYWDWEAEEGGLAEFEVLDTEREMSMEITLPSGEIIVYLGKADVIARNRITRFLWIIDKKTVGSLLDPTFGLQRNEQMIGYMILLTENPLPLEMRGDEANALHVEGAMFSMLRKVKRTGTAKPPFYARAEVRFNRTERENYITRLTYALEDIMTLRDKVEPFNVPGKIATAAQIAYPTPMESCSWDCPYVNICDMFNDGSRVEDVLIEEFEPIDPLERYATAPHVAEPHPVGEKPHADEE